MHSKLKRRVNKYYGANEWQKLLQPYKDMLIYYGAHRIWQSWKNGSTFSEIIGEANLEMENEKSMKKLYEENLQMAKEFEPLVFETMELLNADEIK